MSRQYKESDQIPNAVLAARLDELATVVTKGREAVAREFVMRVPAERDHCPDLVLSEAARRLASPVAASAGVTEEQVELACRAYWGNSPTCCDPEIKAHMRAALLASGLGDGAGWVSAGTIYTLMGSYDYEGCTVLASYASKAGAEAELAKRNAYKASEPRQSDYVNEDGTRDADAWWAASEKWREGLEGASNYDSYYLVEKELLP